MKKLILVLFLLPLFICGLCNKDKNEHWSIPIVNNSNIDIYFNGGEIVGGKYYQENLIPKPHGRANADIKDHIQPGEITRKGYGIIYGKESIEDVFVYADSIRVYFYNANAYDEIEAEMKLGFDYSDPRIYLGYKSYTLNDLERLNWTIVYPF